MARPAQEPARPGHVRAVAPGRAWYSDITYLHTGEGWLYLAVVLDVGSKPAAGIRHERTHRQPDSSPTRSTWAAHTRASRTTGIVFHSDHGTQYLPSKLCDTAVGWRLAQSIGRVRSSANSAVVEAFFSSLKRELVNPAPILGDPSRSAADGRQPHSTLECEEPN